MSFFGLEQNDLERDKQNFLDGGFRESEDVAVYTWGEDSYDGLGDALQEERDELNEDTFGGTGVIGKDFDFAGQALPETGTPRSTLNYTAAAQEPPPRLQQQASSQGPSQSSRGPQSLESIWDDKSPFSVLPRSNGSRPAAQRASSSSRPSPYLPSPQPMQQQPMHLGGNQQTGMRTLPEIEAEMRVNAMAARERERFQQESPQMHHQQAQLQAQQQQQQHQYQLQQQVQQQQQMQAEHMLRQQQQQLRQQQLAMQAQQQQQLLQQQRTPPPRMMPQSQSPRFHLHQQQQMVLLQQQQEQAQQQRLQEMQEQLHMEEIERQLRAQHLSDNQGLIHGHQRQPSGPSSGDLQVLQQQRRRSPPAFANGQNSPPLSQQNLQHIPQSVQMQQRLLTEMAQAELIGVSPAEQEALRMEAMRKIMETERMEDRRRRRASKIAHMSRYNDLMTQSDKDFITRIQVSQLVTQDPYADDFYAQVYGAIMRSRMGLQSQDERVLKFGSGGGVGLGLAQKAATRRPNAMQRMEAQVERIVSSAKIREKEKGLHSLHSLQGALGKTSGRSYKAAPRQLLQVDPNNVSSSPTLAHAQPHISKDDVSGKGGAAAEEAAKLGREALGDAAPTDGVTQKDPLTNRQALVILEGLYDSVLDLEQLRRDQPPEEEDEACQIWEKKYKHLVEELWVGLRVLVPIEISDPHPFVSLLSPAKGKKILPRVTRHLDQRQMLSLMTFLVACFSQLDVVKLAPLLDSLDDSPERREAELQTQTFLGSVLQSILPVVAKLELRIVTGLLSLLLSRSNIVAITQTRPGLAFLTLFLSRVEVIKQSVAGGIENAPLPSADDAQSWQSMLDHLYQLLTPHFHNLFPSTRLAQHRLPMGQMPVPMDALDQPVWQFLAALALQASPEQQSLLVSALREKILENVNSVSRGWVADEEEKRTKLVNVNLFLHALGLDSSQISM